MKIGIEDFSFPRLLHIHIRKNNMERINFVSCSLLSIINVFMYIFLEVIEQISFVCLRAYLHAKQVGYNTELLHCNFELPKMIASILAILFLGIAIFSLFFKASHRKGAD